jgi:hypothetical protein
MASKGVQQLQISDFLDGLFQMNAEKLAYLLTQGVSFKNQGADVVFLAMIDNQKAFSRHERIRMDINQNADFTSDRYYAFVSRSGPYWRPLVGAIGEHDWMIAKLHHKSTQEHREAVKHEESLSERRHADDETRHVGTSTAIEIKSANLFDRLADVLL